MEVVPLFEGVSAISIFLYRYNYIDRKLISKIKRFAIYIQNNGEIIISAEQLTYILENHFTEELNLFDNMPTEALFKNVNSIYFINRLVSQFSKLNYFKISISNSNSYSRLRSEGLVTFDFKILEIKIDLSNFLTTQIDALLNNLGYKSSINMREYEVKAADLADRIDIYGESDFFDESFENILQIIEAHLEEKVLSDNTNVILKLS